MLDDLQDRGIRMIVGVSRAHAIVRPEASLPSNRNLQTVECLVDIRWEGYTKAAFPSS